MLDTVVVDSSVAIKWFVVEPYSVEAHYILEEYQAGTLTLLAPDLLYAELGIGNRRPLFLWPPASASPHPAVPRATGHLPNSAPGGWPCALPVVRRPQDG